MDHPDAKVKINELRAELVSLIDSRLNDILASAVVKKNGTNGCHPTAVVPPSLIQRRVVENTGNGNGSAVADIADEPLDRKQTKRSFPEKQFVMRDSLLTALFESYHARPICNISIAILVVTIMNCMVHDLRDPGTLSLKYEILRSCVAGLPTAITLWLVMFSSTLVLLFPLYQHWACLPGPIGWKDYSYSVVYALYIFAMLTLPAICILAYDLPLASTAFVACEQIRLIAKVHAFVRESAAYALMCKTNGRKGNDFNGVDTDATGTPESAEPPCPDFGNFLYFLFAPTFLYRNNYPRTAKVDWGYVLTNFAQMLGCLFFVGYVVIPHFCIPIFQNFNRSHVTIGTLTLAFFDSVLPGSVCLFLGFFAFLHSWLNAFAEMLRFGDRMFYRDWWNAANLAGYYRTWNVPAYDWLYTYVYRDVCLLFGRKCRTGAVVCVFFFSALAHEYVITMSLRFFYPVMFIEYCCIGVWFVLIPVNGKKKQTTRTAAGNLLLWIVVFLGAGSMTYLYNMEWYARIHCPKVYDNFLDYLIPRSWTCQATSDDLAKTVF